MLLFSAAALVIAVAAAAITIAATPLSVSKFLPATPSMIPTAILPPLSLNFASSSSLRLVRSSSSLAHHSDSSIFFL